MNPRVPFLVWGDLVDSKKPVVRRTLAGYRAHECMYSWVYITDYLMVKRLAEKFKAGQVVALDSEMPIIRLSELLNCVTKDIDPHFQFDLDEWILAYGVAQFIKTTNHDVSISELGSTLFTFKDKVELLTSSSPQIKSWIGIDNSSFLTELSCLFHPDLNGSDFVDDVSKDLCFPDKTRNVFTSRFVASYAFSSSDEFTRFLGKNKFEFVICEEPFSLGREDVHTFNHGQSIVYFSLFSIFEFAKSSGYKMLIIDSYPDNPAKSGRCLNTKFLLYSKNLEWENSSFVDDVSESGMKINSHLISSYEDLSEIVSSIASPEEWKKVDKYKFENPVWSKTPESYEHDFLGKLKQKLKSVYLKYKTGYTKTIHHGHNVDNELARFLAEEFD